jgi:hypothetical protein
MVSFKKNISNSSPSIFPPQSFNVPNIFEPSRLKRKHNVASFDKLSTKIIEKSRQSTLTKLHLMGKSVDGDKIYDDKIVRNISKELSDRLTSLYLIGDAIRAIRKPIKRKEITADEFRNRALDLMTLVNDIFRDDSIYEWWTLRRELE